MMAHRWVRALLPSTQTSNRLSEARNGTRHTTPVFDGVIDELWLLWDPPLCSSCATSRGRSPTG
jgi:hypothetical protein